MRRRYLKKLSIQSDLINNNFDKWKHFVFSGNDLHLSINPDSVNFRFGNINNEIKYEYYEFKDNYILIEDYLEIYKNGNHIKLTYSFKNIVLHLDLQETDRRLFQNESRHILISNISISEDSFIVINEIESKIKDELVMIKSEESIDLTIIKDNEDLYIFQEGILWSEKKISNWKCYDDLLIYSQGDNHTIIPLEGKIKMIY